MKLNVIHLNDRVDRKNLLDFELSTQNINDYKIWPGIRDPFPKRGIAKAHKQIIKYAKEKTLKSIMICEDDIKFTAPKAYNYFIRNEPLDYDIYLGGIIWGNIQNDNSVTDFAGLTLYIVKQQFYDTFLSLPENIDIDRALSGKGKFIVCNPFVAIQHNGYSDNSEEYRNYDLFIKDRKLFGT